MKGKFIFGIMLTFFLLSMLSFGYKIRPAKSEWTGTVYIRADGSIDPPDAPIITYDNITYTLTDNITSSSNGIIVERDNIVIDGASYWLSGANSGVGINLSNRINVTVKNLNIKNFHTGILLFNSQSNNIYGNSIMANAEYGICLNCSCNNNITQNNLENNKCGVCFLGFSNNNIITNNGIDTNEECGIYLLYSSNSVLKNNVTNNEKGIFLEFSSNNNIIGNNIANNQYGLLFHGSNNNCFYHNNFIDNNYQAYDSSLSHPSVNNTWDSGYPSGGNYWNDYTGVDYHNGPYQNVTGSDGIGDSPYNIITLYKDNVDNYPLMGIFHDFEVIMDNERHHVEIISNSTISNVTVGIVLDHYPPYLPCGQMFIMLSVEGTVNTTRFCRVAIPKALLNGTYTVLILTNHGEYTAIPSCEFSGPNGIYSYIYFAYKHTEQKHNIVIVPEYSQGIILASFMLLATLIMLLTKGRSILN